MAQSVLQINPYIGNKHASGLAANTVVKTVANGGKAGYITGVFVAVAGSAAGAVYDAATTGSVATTNHLFDIPATAGFFALPVPIPYSAGIVYMRGTGQTVNLIYV